MVLKKPTKAQYDALFGTLADQVRVALALAFEDSGEPMFTNEESASYRKFRDVVAALKKVAETDVESKVFVTKGLTCIDVFVREVEQLFAITDADARYNMLESTVRAKLRLDGHVLSDEEYEALPYSDRIVAVNNTLADITGDSKNPLAESAKV